MGNLSRWTEDEELYLMEHLDSMSSPQMAEKLKRSVASVRQHLRVMNVRKRPRPIPWSSHEDQTLKEMHSSNATVEDIANALNRTITSVRLRASRYLKLFRSDRHLRATFVSDTFYTRLKAAIVRGTAKAECCICGYSKHVDLHHCDGNNKNHRTENIASLCPNHHREVGAGEHEGKLIFCIWYRLYSDGRTGPRMDNAARRLA